jgi:hypothetical protein
LSTAKASSDIANLAEHRVVNGPKPKIVLRDAINNIIEITANGEYCLVYDKALPPAGLTWRAMTTWWAGRDNLDEEAELQSGRALFDRLRQSMNGNSGAVLLHRVLQAIWDDRL